MTVCLHGVGWIGMGPSPCLQCDQIQRERDRDDLKALRARVSDLETALRDSAAKLEAGIALADKLAREKGEVAAEARAEAIEEAANMCGELGRMGYTADEIAAELSELAGKEKR